MVTIKQSAALITSNEIDGFSNVIWITDSIEVQSALEGVPYSRVTKSRLNRHKEHAKSKFFLSYELPNQIGTYISLVAPSSKKDAFSLMTLARKVVEAQLNLKPQMLSICMASGESSNMVDFLKMLVGAILAANHSLPSFKTNLDAESKIREISVFGVQQKIDFDRVLAVNSGNNLARTLICLPGNMLTPKEYRKKIEVLAEENGWEMDFWDIKKLRKAKAGAFLAVAQGSDKGAGIVHLRYLPRGNNAKQGLSLVGKGICYDTGGTNLKPAKSMFGMQGDMAGSAVALGTLLAFTTLKVDFQIDCWLPICNNMIGPKAYKQNDVIRAVNGTTIEVVHTDAEGRLVLADALALAARSKPSLIIDFATLTGTCITALGTRYSGAFTNREEMLPAIISAGKASGERVWPFPIDEDYDEGLDSDIADIKQCSLESDADHILASRLLSRFVNNTPWLHLDLSSEVHKGGLADIPTDITGVGVGFTVNLISKQDLLSKI